MTSPDAANRLRLALEGTAENPAPAAEREVVDATRRLTETLQSEGWPVADIVAEIERIAQAARMARGAVQPARRQRDAMLARVIEECIAHFYGGT